MLAKDTGLPLYQVEQDCKETQKQVPKNTTSVGD